MENTGNEFPPKEALLSADQIAQLITTFAAHNHAIGLKIGYRQGREDESRGLPWPKGIEKPQ